MADDSHVEIIMEKYLQSRNLNLKTATMRWKGTGISPRFMDQKVTPDVLRTIARCIVDYGQMHPGESFGTKDIWDVAKLETVVTRVFTKPSAKEPAAHNEYDKFVSQPIKTLAYAGLLGEEKCGAAIRYTVEQEDILRFIAGDEFNAYDFLLEYLKETLRQSGMMGYFEKYHNSGHTEIDFRALRRAFIEDLLSYTNIRNEVEIRRIFPKVLNVLAVEWHVPGATKGHVSKSPMTYISLNYNSINFRDKGKDKTETRQQAALDMPKDSESQVGTSLVAKQMDAVKKRHFPCSEVKDKFAIDKATQVHHIFPRHLFPQLVAERENLILLTPQQHYTCAHPDNKTQQIDPQYQIDCLLSKLDNVEESIALGDGFYDLARFVHVLNVGYAANLDEHADAESIREFLRRQRRKVGAPDLA
ncbi:hypothetical protein [Bifidobacterium moukalabense]|uniref:Putative hin4II restriction endonuclease n=1 Tax=Bifidobacterium moukalabense DSM 27321 TaxID=1435051 RepID=W4N760_9BIFI|nr:hypothetical protein [Bifidobacterium moukalabense]ETY70923.1 putative hin4II restriction endonuclease [Bifidobacterium moukalabense DSM 27321]